MLSKLFLFKICFRCVISFSFHEGGSISKCKFTKSICKRLYLEWSFAKSSAPPSVRKHPRLSVLSIFCKTGKLRVNLLARKFTPPTHGETHHGMREYLLLISEWAACISHMLQHRFFLTNRKQSAQIICTYHKLFLFLQQNP